MQQSPESLLSCSTNYNISRLMKQSPDVSPEFRKSLANIDYTSPVCKINVAIDR